MDLWDTKQKARSLRWTQEAVDGVSPDEGCDHLSLSGSHTWSWYGGFSNFYKGSGNAGGDGVDSREPIRDRSNR